MTTINERYKRAYQLLVGTFSTMSSKDKDAVRQNGLDLRWLRNEAGLWKDFEEDLTMVIDDCNQDPNHPDQLSAAVWRSFKLLHLGWYSTRD
tara:strand:- start:1418 stop:1693 length:276 start_codon:yes stop_codon:yes gene_type:complete